MGKGKLIVIAGTDCSGKETQTKLLISRLNEEKIITETMSFPQYESPTGIIVGRDYLGKPHMGESVFNEGAAEVDSLVSASYYAADRRYHLEKIRDILKSGNNLILDRYVSANLGHQGGKIKDDMKRLDLYTKLEVLECGISNLPLINKMVDMLSRGDFSLEEREYLIKTLNILKNGIMELPKPDQTIFLYMPYEKACELKKDREEKPDGLEASPEHLKAAEHAYLQLAKLNDWTQINCVEGDRILTPNEIHEKVYNKCLIKKDQD